MWDLPFFGRILILIGIGFLIAGGILVGFGKSSGLGWLGRLPGDILVQKKNFTFYFPLTTGLILSLLLSAILWFLTRR